MDTNTSALPGLPGAALQNDSDAVATQQQIDRIVYISSLASQFNAVDPWMEDLREVTAAWDGSSPLSTEQRQVLNDLEAKLKQYLINSDPLRTFTEASLAQQVANRGVTKAHPATRNVFVILGASVASVGLAFLPFGNLSVQTRTFLAIPLFFVTLHIGIIWMYLTALKNFKDEMRTAVKLIAVAAVLFAIAFSHYAAIGAFNLQRYEIFQFAGITWLLPFPFIFMYLGLRLYAKQLGIKSWAMSLPIVMVAWAVLMALAALIPAVENQSEWLAIFQNTGSIGMPLFSLAAAVLVRHIRKVVTPIYAKPMMWMYIYMILNFVTTSLANIPFGGDPNGGIGLYAQMAGFGVIDQTLLLMTAYSFKKELSK